MEDDNKVNPPTPLHSTHKTQSGDVLMREKVELLQRDEFFDYLLKTTCKPSHHIPIFRRVLCAYEDETLPRLMSKLSKEGFLSAPVLDTYQRYKGWISMMNLVHYICDMFSFTTSAEWVDFWNKEKVFRETTIKDVMSKITFTEAPEANVLPVHSSDTTFSAWGKLAKTGCHRVAVLSDTTKHVVGILTTSMLISEIDQRLSKVSPALKELKIKDIFTTELSPTTEKTEEEDIPISLHHVQLSGRTQDLITVNENDTVINAFRKMAIHKISGLPIVDQQGSLKGVLSSRDIRGVGKGGEHFARLFWTVKQYKEVMLSDFANLAPKYALQHKPVPEKAVYVTENSTLEDVILKMKDGNLHRVVVCETPKVNSAHLTPIAVISQIDVIRIFYNFYTFGTVNDKQILPAVATQ